MAVENVLSTLITNIYGAAGTGTTSPTLNTAALTKGVLYASSATVAMSATATQYSTYRFFGLPSNAIVHALWATTTGNATGVTAATFGICNRLLDLSGAVDEPTKGLTEANTGLYIPLAGTLSIFGTKSMATAFASTNIVAANLTTLADQQKRIFDLAGAAKDWLKMVDFVVTTNATNTGAANTIGIKAYWSV